MANKGGGRGGEEKKRKIHETGKDREDESVMIETEMVMIIRGDNERREGTR